MNVIIALLISVLKISVLKVLLNVSLKRLWYLKSQGHSKVWTIVVLGMNSLLIYLLNYLFIYLFVYLFIWYLFNKNANSIISTNQNGPITIQQTVVNEN